MGYGLDLGTTALKVVQMRRTLRGVRIVGAVRRRIPQVPPEQYPLVLIKMIHGAMASSDGRRVAVVGLSGRDINLQVVQQPNMKPLNYRMMMNYELEQRQGGATDLYLDYCTLREPDAYFPQYLALIGIGKNSYVDERVGIPARAGADVRDAVPNAMALYAVHRNGYGAEGGTIMLLDLGSDNMDIAFVRGGHLIFARNVSSGARLFDNSIAGMTGASPAEAEVLKIAHGNLGPAGASETDETTPAGRIHAPVRAAAGQLAGFITASINHARVQLNDREFAVDKIYLSGGGARLKGLPEYLSGALRIPVEILDPFRRIDTSGLRGEAVGDFRQLPSDMAVATGLALLATTPLGSRTLSILPPALKKRRQFFRTTFWLLVAAGLWAATLGILTILAGLRKRAQESSLEEFRERTAAMSRRLEEMEILEREQAEISAKIDLLLSHVATGRGTLDVYARLRRVLPPQGLTIRQMRFTEAGERKPTAGLLEVPERRRAAFIAAGRGLVLGEIESEADGKIRIKGESEPFPSAQILGSLWRWPVAAKSLLVVGEADENIRGGPREVLNNLLRELEDKSRGISARLQRQNPSPDKPGWRVFEILMTFE